MGISRCYLHRLLNQLRITGFTLDDDFAEATAPQCPSARVEREELAVGSRVV
jgi:hypothetical protein